MAAPATSCKIEASTWAPYSPSRLSSLLITFSQANFGSSESASPIAASCRFCTESIRIFKPRLLSSNSSISWTSSISWASSMFFCSESVFHSSANPSKPLRALFAILTASVSPEIIELWVVIRPAVDVSSLVSEPVASMMDFKTLGISKPSVEASISAAVRYCVRGRVGALVAALIPDALFFFKSFFLFLSSSDESSITFPLNAASRFSSSFACFVFSRTAPRPAPVGRSDTWTGASLPCPLAPRPWPSTYPCFASILAPKELGFAAGEPAGTAPACLNPGAIFLLLCL